jgi:adenylate cyclase
MAEKGFKRKLTAILSADVEGYSRLMGDDEEATVRTITAYREVMVTLIHQHNGKVLDSPGDNLLAEFVSVVDAVQCAVAVQKEINARNTELPENRKMQFRIGINLGDVIQEEERIYGDGVNIAARLEGLADSGGICISKTAFDHIESKLPYGYEFLGDQTVKNIAKPVGAYRVLMEPRVTVAGKPVDEKPKNKRRVPILIGTIAALLLVLTVGVWQFLARRPTVEPASVEKMAYPLPDKPSIAVLPFTNMSDDPKQEYFSDGITENIIMALSKTPKLFVIARNSSFTYKDKPVKVQQVAEELGVRYILEGSVQKAENRVRITARLIDALDGKHLWAERYDRNLSDIFAIQDELTIKIISALQVKLTEGESSLGVGTDNIDAYLKYLQALKQGQKLSKESNALRRKLAEEAIALDPEYADAYLELSRTLIDDIWFSPFDSAEQLRKRAEELVKKAIAMRDDHAEARALLGRIYLSKRQYDEAIVEGERAVVMAPNSAFVHARLALSLECAGRPEEALALFEKAMRLSPISDNYYVAMLGYCYFDMGQYDEAISAFNRFLDLSPGEPLTLASLAAAYSMLGLEEEARTAAAEVLRIDPKYSVEAQRKKTLYKNPEDVKRLFDAQLRAGLPK